MAPESHVSIGQEIIHALEGSCITKSLMFFLNIVVFLTGMLIVGASGAALQAMDGLDDEFKAILEDNPEIISGLYCMLVSGAVLAFVGFVGCCSSVCENDIMLVFFFTLLLVMFIMQLLGFALAFSKMPRMEDTMRDSMNFVQVRYVDPEGENATVRERISEYLEGIEGTETNETQKQYTLAWIKLQAKSMCCGYDTPDDWEENEFVNAPSWAAYCTEDAFKDLTSANSFARRRGTEEKEDQITSFQERMDDLSKQETHKYGCRQVVFIKMAKMMLIVVIVVFIIELLIISLNARLIHKLRLRNEAAKRAKIHTESVEDEE